MNIKRHLAAVLITTILMSLLAFVGNVFAGELLVIVEGNRTLTVGSDTVDFGSHLFSLEDQVTTGITFGPPGMVVDDTQNGQAAWHVDISIDDLTDSNSGNSISYSNIEIIGDVDGSVDIVGTGNTSGISVLDVMTPFSGTGSQSEIITLMSIDSKNRSAVFTIHPEMEITIPGGTIPGSYENIITITFVVN